MREASTGASHAKRRTSTEDGELKYLDKITKSEEGLSFEQELAKYLTWPGGGYPGYVKAELFQGLENSPKSAESAKKLEPYMIEEAWPTFTHTAEENRVLASTGADIEKYALEMRDKFISGDVPFSEWDKYVDTIEKNGIGRIYENQRTSLGAL